MEKGRPGIDIVNEVLEHCLMAYHHSSFLISLYQQYQKRGSLSKKQLQGLFGKAKEVKDFPAGKLATLEALKKLITPLRTVSSSVGTYFGVPITISSWLKVFILFGSGGVVERLPFSSM